MAAGRNRSTWPKGTPPPIRKPKGAKHKKTILKEKLGIAGWDQLKTYIEGDGAEKLVRELKKLKGKTFVFAVQQMAEYVKPKLSRVDANVKSTVNLKELPVKFE